MTVFSSFQRELRRSGWLLALAVLGWAPALSAQAQESASGTTGAEYLIGIGDVVVTSVWRNPELEATVPVRPDGKIAFPLIGEVEVAGRTPADLRERLTEGYERFITAPAVSVVIREINSRKVFVLGEVEESGAYDILRPTRLLQALAMAGGLTEYAKKDQVVVLREDGGRDVRFEVSIRAITSGRQIEDNLLLRPGDTIVVP